MPERWLQIKGDPSVGAFLFEQESVASLLGESLDRVHQILKALLVRKGGFHANIHYSSSQLTCWFAQDPFVYEKYVRKEVLDPGFLDRFPDRDHAGRQALLGPAEIDRILKEFRRLRLTDQTIYLRNASINLINGMINMTFSCDGSHYIDYQTFLAKLDRFETTEGAH